MWRKVLNSISFTGSEFFVIFEDVSPSVFNFWWEMAGVSPSRQYLSHIHFLIEITPSLGNEQA